MTYEKYNDYASNNASLKQDYADAAIDVGTKVCVDFLDPNCYSAGAVPGAGALAGGFSFINLADSANPLSAPAGVANGIGTAGIHLSAGESIALPNTVKMVAGATHFGFGAWIKPDAYASAQSYESLVVFATNTSTNAQYFVQRAKANDTTYASYFGVTGAYITVATAEVAFIFFEAIVSSGNITVNGYKNAVLVNSAAAALSGGVLPVPASSPVLGKGGPYGAGFEGSIGRFVFEDFSVVGTKTVAQFLADELAQGAGPRFT
jgi:hypothetical protein